MTDLHKEINLEVEICEHLAAHGWLYSKDDAKSFLSKPEERKLALYAPDLFAWLEETQPSAWESLSRSHGTNVKAALLQRVRECLDRAGTLDVLRHGIEMVGVKGTLSLSQFKPALAMNPETLKKYAANRLRVVRQVHYSESSESSIDLVLYLNGIPVATLELKTDFTQSVDDAVDQYRFDRNPKPKGQGVEPLLQFASGALVHFAVSNREVKMTTKLEGPGTDFLPFNLGDNGGAGNPNNDKGHRTAYLWEQILERESWLEILGRYLVAERDKKKNITRIIFPRFHQLDATRKLVAAVLAEGPGGKYLIQHSAGSGKTNSIAWSAHFLADLHNQKNEKIFDSVLVVSDRTVIDSQLQDAIFSFERTTGVVATITGEGGSKSGELAKALSEGKKVLVCTIQTFPFAITAVRELSATQGKRFAVIADEAHSSQTGEAAAKLKTVLSAEELKEVEDGGEISSEDLLLAQMTARSKEAGITYVAFTATPKSKTLELFGRVPNPALPAGPENLPEAFHVYSMRQAIEEGFILDVLQNYTPYKTAFKLAHDGKVLDDKAVERSEAVKGLMRWVRLHPYNIAQKVQIVVEHFLESVSPLLNGRAKAMVVTASRLEAVRWKMAIDKYIASQGYKIATLVAFSGEVSDKENVPPLINVTEESIALNPNLRRRGIREAFNTDEFQILLVANKFQTGFDQSLLCGMYVDKRLAGIQAVQTLSRLNRSHKGKDTTYVLDFVNDPAEVLEAFKPYYTTARLSDITDPNLVYNLKSKLDSAGFYDEFEVERVVTVSLSPNSKQSDLSAAVEHVASRLVSRYKAVAEQLRVAKLRSDAAGEKEAQDEINALTLFKHDIGTFQRAYAFLSQIFDYGNTALEKRYIFFRVLLPLLEFQREREGIDLSRVILTHHSLRNQGKRALTLTPDDATKLYPLTEAGGGEVREKERAYLSEIIEKVNELFDGELTDDDKLVYVNNVLKGKLMESEVLRKQAANNSKEQFANSPDLNTELLNAIMDALAAHKTMSSQALGSEKVRNGLREILLGPARLYEALRERVDDEAAKPKVLSPLRL